MTFNEDSQSHAQAIEIKVANMVRKEVDSLVAVVKSRPRRNLYGDG